MTSSDPQDRVENDRIDWLEGLWKRIEGKGSIQVVHLIPGMKPRLRLESSGELTPLDEQETIEPAFFDWLIEGLLDEQGRSALQKIGEVEFPFEPWRGLTGKFWVCEIFLARDGGRILFKCIEDISTWLESQ